MATTFHLPELSTYFRTPQRQSQRQRQDLNVEKQKWEKVPDKLSVAQKSEPVLQRALQQDISLIIVFFVFSQRNLVFKFNLQLIK